MSYPLGAVEADQRTEFYAEPENRQPRARFRGLAAGLIILVFIGLSAGGMWFAYLQGMRHVGGLGGKDVPLIRADTGPTKVKPEKPGGMEVPDRDKLIYTQKRAAVEHLLPAPEKPILRPGASGVSMTQPEPGQLPSGSAPTTTAPSPAAGTTNSPGKAAAKPAAAQPSPGKASGTRIQLASVHSEQAALQEWNRIKRANSDLLANISAAPVRVDLGDKGIFYRVLSGPVADADRICQELNQRKVGCIIAH